MENTNSEAYGEFLAASYDWDYFGTLTLADEKSRVSEWIFRGHVHRFFWLWYHLEAVRLGGAKRVPDNKGRDRFSGPLARAYKRKRGRLVYVFAVEPHRWRSALHGHFLVYAPQHFRHYLDFGTGHEAWAWGGTKFERPQNQGDVSAYVSKYIAKGGELEFSESFESDRLRTAQRAGAVAA